MKERGIHFAVLEAHKDQIRTPSIVAEKEQLIKKLSLMTLISIFPFPRTWWILVVHNSPSSLKQLVGNSRTFICPIQRDV